MSTLFVNACVRADSRTRRLAQDVLNRAEKPVLQHNLAAMNIRPLDEAALNFRTELAAKKIFDDPLFCPAKEFARADEIVIAAPYWDLSFPAVLKAYIEQIMVCGIVFAYAGDGRPVSLCRAKNLTYVSTSGGSVFDGNAGYTYIKSLANTFWGIENTRLVQAENLDIVGADVEKILSSAIQSINRADLS